MKTIVFLCTLMMFGTIAYAADPRKARKKEIIAKIRAADEARRKEREKAERDAENRLRQAQLHGRSMRPEPSDVSSNLHYQIKSHNKKLT